MVYRKRKYNKYKKKPSNGYYKHGMNALDLASKALVVAYGVKKLLNVEFKFFDVTQTETAMSQTPQIVQLTNIPQGDTDVTRDGAQVKLTRLDIKYLIRMNTAASTAIQRIMLIHDKQTNQAIYNASDLLLDTTSLDNIVTPLNLDNKYRFRVLYNKVHTMSVNGNRVNYGHIGLNLDMKIRFDASTPSIADLTSNSLSILLISTEQGNAPTLSFISRVRYLDN